MDTKQLSIENSPTVTLMSMYIILQYSYLTWAEFGRIYSSFLGSILHVVSKCTNKQMSNAGWRITPMQHFHIFWDWSVNHLPCIPVCKYTPSRAAEPEYSIPMIINLGAPQPARTKFLCFRRSILINFRPESSGHIGLICRHGNSIPQGVSETHSPFLG